MAIQSLPPFFDMVYSKPDGHLATDGFLYNDHMYQTLSSLITAFNFVFDTTVNTSLSGTNPVTINGLVPPSFTTAQITDLLPNVSIGTIWYNNTLNKLQFKSGDNLIETITSA